MSCILMAILEGGAQQVPVSWLLITSVLAITFGFSCVIMLRRRQSRAGVPDWNWIEDFSIDRYRPMQRLLCQEDYVFLESQRGYDPSISRTLRKDRRRVFRSYLHSMH